MTTVSLEISTRTWSPRRKIRVSRHGRLGHGQGLGPQHQEPAIADSVRADARDGHTVAALRLHDNAEVTELDDPDREEVGGTESLGDGPARGSMVKLGRIADLQ